MLQFLVKTPGQPDREVRIDSDSFSAGSDPDLPLVIDDPVAGWRQFRIEVRPVGVVLKDLSSESGTKVNGSFVSQVRLGVGDLVEVGGATIILTLVSGAAPRPAAVPPVVAAPAPAAVPVASPAATSGARPRLTSTVAPRVPRERSRAAGMIIPLLVLALLGGAAAAAIIFLNAPKADPKPVAGRPPADIPAATPEAGVAPEAGTEIPGLPPLEDLPPPAPLPDLKPIETEPLEPDAEPVAEVPEPEPAAAPDLDAEARRERERLESEGRDRMLRLAETLPDRIARYSFDGAIADLEGIVGPLPRGAAREEAEGLLADVRGARRVFARTREIFAAGEKVKVTLASGLDLTVTGADEEGFTASVGRATVKKRWTELDAASIHAIVARRSREVLDWLELSAFAYLYDLPDGLSESDLLRAFRKDETAKPKIDASIARRRGIDFPPGGFLLHEGEWVTREEKGNLDRGLVLHEGRWLTRDEVMVAKGYVQHDGRWLSPEDYEEVLEAQREADELAKKFLPKGLIDRPGYGKAVCEWKKVPTLKTRHYRIRTNLDKEVQKDIAYTMEILRTNLKSIFGLRGKGSRFTINLVSNRDEYHENWPRSKGSLGFCSGSEIVTFYQPPMTTAVLMHEGTHQMVRWLEPTTPRWLHEGMATFFECSRFEFDAEKRRVGMKVGMINSMRLASFQAEKRAGRTVPLTEFMRGKGGNPYTQGWAFVYYLAKGGDGKYARKLHQFIGEAHKTDVVERFQKIFRVKDMQAFEEEWLAFIMALNPADGARLANPLN